MIPNRSLTRRVRRTVPPDRPGMDGQNAEMEANKLLVREFGAAALGVLAPGPAAQVHVTHKTKPVLFPALRVRNEFSATRIPPIRVALRVLFVERSANQKPPFDRFCWTDFHQAQLLPPP